VRAVAELNVSKFHDVRRPPGNHTASNVRGFMPVVTPQGIHQLQFESLVERTHWMRLLIQDEINGAATQPVALTWRIEDMVIQHIPDILLKSNSYNRKLVDVHQLPFGDASLVKFLLTSRLAESLGWTYEVWRPMTAQTIMNLNHLHSFRQVTTAVSMAAEHLMVSVSWPASVFRVMHAEHREKKINLGAMYHLLLKQRLSLDLDMPITVHRQLRDAKSQGPVAAPWLVDLDALLSSRQVQRRITRSS